MLLKVPFHATLLAKELINNDDSLVIANSDQFVEWNANEVMYVFLLKVLMVVY